jgi:hemerythrin-like domain-containing protein
MMEPIGPLMIEHRLIERMVELLDAELGNIEKTSDLNTEFIYVGVDFFRTYADRTHHGKEEQILFRELSQKKLSTADNEKMERLIQEHIWARDAVGRLYAANGEFLKGNRDVIKVITYELGKLVKFYPMHIEKEDKHFFIPAMDYFSIKEQDAMLNEFWEFDKIMIHEKYKRIVEEYEKKNA